MYNDIYTRFVEDQLCDQEPYEVGGLASARPVYAMQHDPRLNLKPLEAMAIQACKTKQTIRYSQFRKQICHSKTKKQSAKPINSDDGIRYRVNYNNNGAVLEAKSGTKIYLSKDCDAYSKANDKGIWTKSTTGFQISFESKKILFSKQKLDIPNTAKCAR